MALTVARYVNGILDMYVPSYAFANGSDFILMDDNDRPHKAWVTNESLQTATLARMDRPAKYPDLNPIENALDMLQTAISARQSS